MLATLTHELVHAVDDCQNGHKAPFKRIATSVGLEGKMTATHAGERLNAQLVELAESLGTYPHSLLTPPDPKKRPGSRLLKCSCSACGYTVRVTRQWLDTGAPICPCNSESMVET